jgi:hypothetical protein
MNGREHVGSAKLEPTFDYTPRGEETEGLYAREDMLLNAVQSVQKWRVARFDESEACAAAEAIHSAMEGYPSSDVLLAVLNWVRVHTGVRRVRFPPSRQRALDVIQALDAILVEARKNLSNLPSS